MSQDEAKSAIRLYLPELDGQNWNDVYPYFKQRLGEADNIDETDGVIEWFCYASNLGEHYQVLCVDKMRWVVDLVLDRAYLTEWNGLNESLAELDRKAFKFADIFCKLPQDCRIVAYTWYNGVDEPVEIGDGK